MEWSERIGRRIRLRDLHILLAVVQHKSMAKAAEHLAISKPVISKAIADLEHVVGVRLLERDRHGAEATPHGAALIKRGIAVFDELRDGVKDIESLNDPQTGEVRIGCTPNLAASFVATVVDRLSRRCPRMTFEIVSRPIQALEYELSERNVDLLVTRSFGAFEGERFDFEPLFDDVEAVVTGKQNRLARRRKIELAELVNERWTLPPVIDAYVGLVAETAFRAYGLPHPRTVVVSDSPHVRMTLLATGHFVSIFPRFAVRFPVMHPDLKILPVKLPLIRPAAGAVTLRNRMLRPAVQLFIDTAREVAKPLAKVA
jgi:DNA-binding transcriptional LysR family regulator